MNFSNPWDNIKIKTMNHKEIIQYFDSRIHIIYVLLGEAVLKNQEQTLTLQRDDFYILSKAEKYEVSVKNKGKVFYFTLDYFIKNNSDSYVYAFKGDSVNKPKATDTELLYNLKQLLLLKTLKDSSNFSKIFKQYFTLITLLEQYYQVELRSNIDQSIKGQIEDLKFYIDNNFEKDIKLSDLAEQLYITEQYLSRVFKEQNGIGISEYLIKRRLSKVRQLLLETQDSITDIAFSAGFSNINSFNRVFKKYQGMTPSQYRYEAKKELQVIRTAEEINLEDYDIIQEYFKKEPLNSEVKQINISQEKKIPFNPNKLMINLGYAGDLLKTSLVKEIGFTIDYTSFQYGRIWGLLSDTILRQKDDYFDFSKVDEIIQNILDLGLTPFLDLGFKGKQIHESISRIVSQEEFHLPSNDMTAILKRYEALCQHLLSKFGYDEVANWKIEIWKPNAHVLETVNQTDLALLCDGNDQIDLRDNSGYYLFFSQVKRTIKAIIPDIEVGGSGISLDLEAKNYRFFVEGWSHQQEKPDFLSLSVFPLDTLKEGYDSSKNNEMLISANSDFLKGNLQKARLILEESGLCSQLIVSEFNITNSGRDLINDSAFKGPYILKNLLSVIDSCDLIGYWQLSDVSFTTFDVNQKEIFGGAGLISKSGIAKPSFFAFDFLNSLGDQLLYQSNSVIVTQKRSKVMILLYHYCHLNNLYYYSKQEKFNKTTIASMFENDGNSKYLFHFEKFNDGKEYKFKIRRVGVADGSFLTESNQLSLKDNFSREEISYLKFRCIPTLRRKEKRTKEDGLDFQIELAPHDMVLIEVER
ncbi:GH39 family glycosyl hydrolase [Streptococcus orisasini]